MMRFLIFPAVGMATHMPPWFAERLRKADRSDSPEACNAPGCEKPLRKYQNILDVKPGVQWFAHGGYCGAWSIQRAAMAKGAYMSQQQVRDHATFGGGHDNEILNTNIDGALRKLKLRAEGFEYNVLPTPQSSQYLKFMKKSLSHSNPIIWMVMFGGDDYPDIEYKFDNTTNGVYAHIEPVIGIMSNHPLSDEAVHDDDAFVYFDDVDKITWYQKANEVSGDWSPGSKARCPGLETQCVWKERGYIWSIQGFLDHRPDALPASLSISPWASEPYTRGGEEPVELTGTLTVTGLKEGSVYDIYRWGSPEEAFMFNQTYKIETFTATAHSHKFVDPQKFLSNSTTYYRCVQARKKSSFLA
mmetsp:Transcript_78167/g.203702  ORF Transcript_78167/g.203702 Transcript_78167/m.203702 type:complete len:358 (+) Transcript_78167:86-1159(+)